MALASHDASTVDRSRAGPFAASEQVTFFAPEPACTVADETILALRVGSEPRGRAFFRTVGDRYDVRPAPEG